MNLRATTLSDLPAIAETYNSTVPGRAVTADTEPSPSRAASPGFTSTPRSGSVSSSGPTVEVSIYIAAKHRRRGIAKRLLAEAIRHAPAQQGLKTLTAGAFAHNEPSLILLEQFGFEPWAHFPRVAELDEEPALG